MKGAARRCEYLSRFQILDTAQNEYGTPEGPDPEATVPADKKIFRESSYIGTRPKGHAQKL